jgi:antiviral helicase SLH1
MVGAVHMLYTGSLWVSTGISRDTSADDPQLGNKRNELVSIAARKLAQAHMIVFNPSDGSLTSNDLGRIAAKYYIRRTSIELFNKEFRPKMTEADVLAMLSMSMEVSFTAIYIKA